MVLAILRNQYLHITRYLRVAYIYFCMHMLKNWGISKTHDRRKYSRGQYLILPYCTRMVCPKLLRKNVSFFSLFSSFLFPPPMLFLSTAGTVHLHNFPCHTHPKLSTPCPGTTPSPHPLQDIIWHVTIGGEMQLEKKKATEKTR